MKQSENNEIDTLLRNLARRERAAQTRPGSAAASTPGEFAAKGAHLDIDELSSYAERALPPSARARCTTHLADCDDCRKIVAQLSMAVGPLAEEGKLAGGAVPGLTWVQKLAKLLSPGLLRYAMPALVLVVVAVAFFGWRQQRANDYVALNKTSQPAGEAQSVSEPTAASDRPEAFSRAGQLRKEANAQPATTPAAPVAGATTAKAESESRDEKKLGDVASDSRPASKAGKEDAPADKVAVAKPAYAPEPPPAAPKAASPVAVNQEQQKDLARNNVAEERERGRDVNVNVQRQGPARNDNEVSQRGPAKNQQQQPAAKMKAAETGSAAGARAEDDEAEKRTLFGRHFRRVNNAWVDTGYNSSMSIRSVTRGTEEYGSLIADEPVIGSISRQLSGEVIVVWKARAYRIN